jgi:glycine/D-amino acid oxidase-like deaminating enzyme
MSDVDDALPRPGLAGDLDVDVAIVGGGFTGLWTAYYLNRSDPGLRIVVLEAETAGFGASGRNGGWCSALFPQSLPALARRHGAPAAMAMHRAMRATVDEVGRVAWTEGIDCHYARGGTIALARTPAQLARARDEVDRARAVGVPDADLSLLDADAARAHCAATGVLGGVYTPDCAAIHPARLVRGLAGVVEGRGVRIAERTRAVAVRPGAVVTESGTVRAEVVVRATEGYTRTLRGHRRTLAPVYSLMIATEPLPDRVWDEIGLRARETFTDFRHLIIYGQRTADGRLAFGGRGAPYHYGSAIRPSYDVDPRVHAELARVLRELFPAVAGARVTHAWGGPLGVAADWTASVGLDRERGLAWAGGYVGDGVSTSNLAGRTLADLITGADTDLLRLPWVGHRSPRWVPEPLRWLGTNAGLRLMESADAVEARSGHSSLRARLFGRLVGQS